MESWFLKDGGIDALSPLIEEEEKPYKSNDANDKDRFRERFHCATFRKVRPQPSKGSRPSSDSVRVS